MVRGVVLLGLAGSACAFAPGALLPGNVARHSGLRVATRPASLALSAKLPSGPSGRRPLVPASLTTAPLAQQSVELSASTTSGDAATPAVPEEKKINLLLLGAYFFAWYALNVGYNITNKQVLNVFPCYATVATMQLVVAWFWLVPQWLAGIRPIPKPSKSGIDALQKIAVFNGVGHLVTVLSMGLGAVSFVHVVKAAEPVFAAVLSAIFAGSVMAAPVYASLIPVMFGVGLASAGELSFTWACFGCAMMSNLLFASRAVFSKIAMSSGDQGENMDSANTFAVVTMISTLICLPVALILEHSKVLPAWNAAIAVKGMTQTKLATTLIASGFFLYTYNEFAFKVLGLVSPVAQAVGNTVKRVVVIIAGTIVFNKPLTTNGIIGSTVAIGGVLLYSLAKSAGSAPAAKAKGKKA